MFETHLMLSLSPWDNILANETLIEIKLGLVPIDYPGSYHIIDISSHVNYVFILTEDMKSGSCYEYKLWRLDLNSNKPTEVYKVISEKLQYRIEVASNAYLYAEGGASVMKIRLSEKSTVAVFYQFYGAPIQEKRKIIKLVAFSSGVVDVRLWLGKWYICRTDDPFKRKWKSPMKGWHNYRTVDDLKVVGESILFLNIDRLIEINLNDGSAVRTLRLDWSNTLSSLPFPDSFLPDKPIILGKNFDCVIVNMEDMKLFLIEKHFKRFQHVLVTDKVFIVVQFYEDSSWCLSRMDCFR
ncbi:unnamed protein product [Dimorphilus gyrociliatus]|uniref:Uncharacterized protein n=1 Tax=Dimorphilus gyrociliatus TaxID=2664684 RepID=A0A7I8V9Z1_9ANNE|nr:unnamed protein product [Dimorphilus gyrociliatus]